LKDWHLNSHQAGICRHKQENNKNKNWFLSGEATTNFYWVSDGFIPKKNIAFIPKVNSGYGLTTLSYELFLAAAFFTTGAFAGLLLPKEPLNIFPFFVFLSPRPIISILDF
jgi:hypothetical protein